jgi:LysR family cyn operon transcriptional activator
MNLDHLRYFLVASKTQHIGKAAAQARVSPSAISHSLRKLESQLGQRLFQKTGKNIFLTDFGKRFALRGARLLDQADGLLHEFRDSELPISGSLKVAASHGLSNHVVAGAIAKLQTQHPKLLFESYSLRSAEVIDQVSRGLVDVGVCFSPTSQPAISVLFGAPQKLVICVRKSHGIRKLRGARLIEELSRQACASPKAFSGVEICDNHPSLKALGIAPNVSMIFDSYDVAAAYVKTTDAWCLMPKRLAEIHGLAELKIQGFKAEATIAVIAPKGRTLPPALLGELRSALSHAPIKP